MSKKRKRRADGLYQANVVVGIDPKTGKYIRKPVYDRDETNLEIKKAKIQDSVRKGTYADDKGIKFQDYAYSWLKRYKANPELENPMDSHTYRDYRNIIKNHLGPLKDMRLQKIQKQDILEAIALLNGHYDLQRRLRMTVNQILDAAIKTCAEILRFRKNRNLPNANLQRKKLQLPCLCFLIWKHSNAFSCCCSIILVPGAAKCLPCKNRISCCRKKKSALRKR